MHRSNLLITLILFSLVLLNESYCSSRTGYADDRKRDNTHEFKRPFKRTKSEWSGIFILPCGMHISRTSEEIVFRHCGLSVKFGFVNYKDLVWGSDSKNDNSQNYLFKKYILHIRPRKNIHLSLLLDRDTFRRNLKDGKIYDKFYTNIPVTVGAQLLYTKAYVENEKQSLEHNFMLDSGANVFVISAEVLRAIGINPDKLTYSGIVKTAGKNARSAGVTIPFFRFGGVSLKNQRFTVIEGGRSCLIGINTIPNIESYKMALQKPSAILKISFKQQ